ncbi:hypothetical protein [Nocardia sp. NPDC002869]|uniref:hypothetical protein n=1 Tax=Nocardia sp. NPDC002869 TaxID=3161032 RepID=UPI00398CA32F
MSSTNAGEVGGFETFRARGNESHTIATALHGAGYRTGMADKYLNGLEDDPGHIPPGWDDLTSANTSCTTCTQTRTS